MSTPDDIYLFKANNRNTRKRREICSKLTVKQQKDVSKVILKFFFVDVFVKFFFSITNLEQVNVSWGVATQKQKQMLLILSFWIEWLLSFTSTVSFSCFVYLIQKALWSVRKSLQSIFMLKNVASSICCKFWASCENFIFKYSSDSASTIKRIFYIINWWWKCQWWKWNWKRNQ